jgi:hypothetical protein
VVAEAAGSRWPAGTWNFSVRLRRFQSTVQVLSEAPFIAVNQIAGWADNDNHFFACEVVMEHGGFFLEARLEAKQFQQVVFKWVILRVLYPLEKRNLELHS